MTWQEILNCERFVQFGCTCGGWHQYTRKDNIKYVPSLNTQVPKAIDESRVVKIRGNKMKIMQGNRWFTYPLSHLDELINTI